jgi:hypothetical protein
MKTEKLTTGNIGNGRDETYHIDKVRAKINEMISQGLENLPGELIAMHGLDDEYPELMAKLVAEDPSWAAPK